MSDMLLTQLSSPSMIESLRNCCFITERLPESSVSTSGIHREMYVMLMFRGGKRSRMLRGRHIPENEQQIKPLNDSYDL